VSEARQTLTAPLSLYDGMVGPYDVLGKLYDN
jgi:hypothetical protein